MIMFRYFKLNYFLQTVKSTKMRQIKLLAGLRLSVYSLDS